MKNKVTTQDPRVEVIDRVARLNPDRDAPPKGQMEQEARMEARLIVRRWAEEQGQPI
jgi:hypothetical protein